MSKVITLNIACAASVAYEAALMATTRKRGKAPDKLSKLLGSCTRHALLTAVSFNYNNYGGYLINKSYCKSHYLY